MNTYSLFAVTLLTSSLVYANSDSISHLELDATASPAHNFDLSKWKINLPELETEGSRKGKTVEINKHQHSNTNESYSHPKWFYTDPQTGAMTFVAPNDAPTTPNSSNTRSELRAMLGDKAHSPSNNFAIATHKNADEFAAIGGQMSATLSVDNVSTSGKYSHNGAFSVVIGQIHGSHNEPLKISYRKLPEHEFGSLVWAYELNPSPEQQDAVDDKGKKLRQDIRHNVFGQFDLRQGDEDPIDGIKLGEVFSYDVNVEGTIMTLTFVKHPNTPNAETKTYQVDLAEGNYQGHKVDLGYGQDWMYYKAGAYNQCNTKASSTACEWRGMDAGDFVKVRFYELELNQ